MNWGYISIASVIIFSLYSLFIYNKGYTAAMDKNNAIIQQEKIRNTSLLRDLENKHREHENAIIAEYMKQVEELNTKYEDLSNAKLSNTVKCVSNNSTSRRVSSSKDKSSLICYTEPQLRDKIKRSMAITRECDTLALKYNALLQTCTNITTPSN